MEKNTLTKRERLIVIVALALAALAAVWFIGGMLGIPPFPPRHAAFAAGVLVVCAGLIVVFLGKDNRFISVVGLFAILAGALVLASNIQLMLGLSE